MQSIYKIHVLSLQDKDGKKKSKNKEGKSHKTIRCYNREID